MKCAYCQAEIKRGTGMMYIYKTGDIVYYCSGSCYKNDIAMGRKMNKKLLAKGSPAKKVEAKAKA